MLKFWAEDSQKVRTRNPAVDQDPLRDQDFTETLMELEDRFIHFTVTNENNVYDVFFTCAKKPLYSATYPFLEWVTVCLSLSRWAHTRYRALQSNLLHRRLHSRDLMHTCMRSRSKPNHLVRHHSSDLHALHDNYVTHVLHEIGVPAHVVLINRYAVLGRHVCVCFFTFLVFSTVTLKQIRCSLTWQ